MEPTDKIKPNVRILIFIVSLPFWVFFLVKVYGLYLGDPLVFEVTDVFSIVALYVFFRIVILGRPPIGSA